MEDVSFSVEQGEFIAIIGPNGGGKTTLLKLIMGFLKPKSGTISLFGQPPAKEYLQLAYVPQTLGFDRHFPISVRELVLSGRLAHLTWYGTYRQEDIKIAEEAMERVGLLDKQHLPFGTLSGGQAQRALIARALASRPRLLLLDEPTANIDAAAESELYTLLKTLSNSMTILMVTHDLTAAIERVDRVICVRKEVISLKPQEVCEHYAMGLYHPPLLRLGSKGAS